MVNVLGRNYTRRVPRTDDLKFFWKTLCQQLEVLLVSQQLRTPFDIVDLDCLLKRRLAHRQALQVHVLVPRADTEHVVHAASCRPVHPTKNPLQHAHVLSVAGPQEVFLRVATEPVHAEDLRRRRHLLLHVEPMLEVVTHVVAAERKHCKRVAAHYPQLPEGRRRRLRAHSRRHVHSLRPRPRLRHQRHRRGAPPAEDEGVDDNARRVVPALVAHGVVDGRHGEARVGVRRLASRLLADLRRPLLTLPVHCVLWRRAQALPPHVAVVGQRYVGVDYVAGKSIVAVGVGLRVSAWRDAEVARLGVDGVELAVAPRHDPRDVVAERRDLPALELLAHPEHREVGLAARAREGSRDVVLLACGARHTHQKHVLGEPALVPTHLGRDAEREALFAENCASTVARPVAPHFPCFGEMDEVLHAGVARPSSIFGACA